MKRSIHRLLPVLFAGMFMYTGCAKQEVVKRDESLAPTVAPASPNQGAAATKTTPLKTGEQKKAPLKHEAAETADQRNAFEKIYFDFDSSALNDAARQALTKNFAVLKQNPQAKIRVEGHCDERGSNEYNLALGEVRAQTAARYLKTMGVAADRLSTISYGKEKPADPGHDEAAWAKNRRDEFVIAK